MALLRLTGWLFALLLLMVAGFAIFILTFDANRYKPELAALVKEKTGRELQIGGDIDLTVYPDISLQLGQATLGNAAGFRGERFAAAEDARISVQLLPLLQQQLRIDAVHLQGLRVNLQRNQAGQTNWGDLLAGAGSPQQNAEEPGEVVSKLLGSFVVAGISVSDAEINWQDDVAGKTMRLAPLNLQTGVFTPGQPVDVRLDTRLTQNQPPLDMQLQASTTATLAANQTDITLAALELQVNLPATLNARMQGNLQGNLSKQQFLIPDLQATLELPQQGTVRLTGRLDANLPQEELRLTGLQANANLNNPATGEIDASLSGNASLNLANQQATLAGMQLQASLQGGTLPLQQLQATASGETTYDLSQQQLAIAGLQLATDVQAEAIPGGQLQQQGNGTLNLNLASGKGLLDFPQMQLKAAEQQLDGNLQVRDPLLPERSIDGQFRADELRYPPFAMQQATLAVHLENGKLELKPQGKLFQGDYQGDIRLDLEQTPPTLQSSHTVEQLRTEDLFFALTEDRLVTGALGMTAQINSVAGDADVFKRNLGGQIALNLQDGTIRDASFAQKTREVVKLFEKERVNEVGEKEVAFTSLNGQWQISQGVFSTAATTMTAPQFKVDGNGDVNIVDESLDFKLRVGEKPQPEEPEGLFAPLHIHGPWNNLSYALEVDVLLKALAQRELDREKARLEERLEAEKQKQLEALKQKRDEAAAQLRQKVADEKARLEQRLQDELQKQLGSDGQNTDPAKPQEPVDVEDQLKQKLEDELKDKLKGLF